MNPETAKKFSEYVEGLLVRMTVEERLMALEEMVVMLDEKSDELAPSIDGDEYDDSVDDDDEEDDDEDEEEDDEFDLG